MTSTLDAAQSSATGTPPKNKPQGKDDGADEKAISKSRTDLLDAEGDLSPAFHLALARIFLRFSASAQKLGLDLPNAAAAASEKDVGAQLDKLKKVALDDDELDAFARATNGEVLSDESKEEIKEYLDCDDQSRITFSGFCEMYHLQTGSDAAETWKDLEALGFNEKLELDSPLKADASKEERST
ncbi:hypothetical protein FA10DRAFT_265429 [Acaromyces ingoldii]|uniref:EF-hand domain-containing protein n=1 Tax=Acaromyces ingoldii TaxID=215250 RepID=A0A316YQR9_9BASI|nr:hypothetical protein FA10DRAFT_265429 [Acaromyces ingoldii]PWN91581.1 hypothetical protein FA10DRAFT_265429 [Acaromyces ingoldii]